MLKLFAVLLGGRAPGCNVELHDVVFVVGDSLAATYSQLSDKWFGSKKRLHIDSSIELKYVDDHEIVISKTKPQHTQKLFFVNFGAYVPNYFGEKHEVGFYVANSKPDVLARAKKELCVSLIQPHCDDNVPIDDVIAVNAVDGYYIELIPTDKPAEITIKSAYQPLPNVGKPV